VPIRSFAADRSRRFRSPIPSTSISPDPDHRRRAQRQGTCPAPENRRRGLRA
jgi:hypothetical protein